MKLQFRGKTYERSDLALDVCEGEVGGVYRGKSWKTHHLKHQHRRIQPKMGLVYRGVHYTRG